MRIVVYTAAAALALGAGVAAGFVGGAEGPAGARAGVETVNLPPPDSPPRSTLLARQLSKERKAHSRELTLARRDVRRYRAALRHDPSVTEAITIASALSGISIGALNKVARCESTHRPWARNGRYVGLFQFGGPAWSQAWGKFAGALPRTSPYASAIGHARIVANEGYGQWECKP